MDLSPESFTIASPGPIAAMGDAIADRLKFAFPTTKFAHDFIPAKLDKATWGRLLRRLPFVGLGFVQLHPVGGGRQFVGDAHWVVCLVTRNEAGPRQRFFGDRLAPGALQMMQVAVAMLQGHTLEGLNGPIGTIAGVTAENGYAEDWADDAVAMIALSLTVPIAFGVAEALANVDVPLLGSSRVDWSFDSGASVALTENPQGGV